jgi:hypothetical protein
MEKKIGMPLVELAKLVIGKTSTLDIDLNNVTMSLGDSKALKLNLGGKLKINISHLK